MKLLLLPLLLGLSVPAIAHNEANGGCGWVDCAGQNQEGQNQEGQNQECDLLCQEDLDTVDI